jgi:Rod binding domain-containing protein
MEIGGNTLHGLPVSSVPKQFRLGAEWQVEPLALETDGKAAPMQLPEAADGSTLDLLSLAPGFISVEGGSFSNELSAVMRSYGLKQEAAPRRDDAASDLQLDPGWQLLSPEQQARRIEEQAERERIKETARQFEALLLGQMLKQVWKNLEQGEIAGMGAGGSMYREMWLDEIARGIATGPQRLGLADQVECDLLRQAGLGDRVKKPPMLEHEPGKELWIAL